MENDNFYLHTKNVYLQTQNDARVNEKLIYKVPHRNVNLK